MKILLFFIFCTFSVFAQTEHNVTIFYEYTADGYALYAANEEEYPVTIEFDFDLLNLKVVREGPSAIVVPAEAKKKKLVDLVAINVLKGYSFEYTHTVKEGAIKVNVEDIIAVSDRAAFKTKKFSKNVDTTDEPIVSITKRNPRELRESRIAKRVSTTAKPKEDIQTTVIPADASEIIAKTEQAEPEYPKKPIVKTEPTQVAIAKAVKQKEREAKKIAEKKRAEKKPIPAGKVEPIILLPTSTEIVVKDVVKKTIAPETIPKPNIASESSIVIESSIENISDQVLTDEPIKMKEPVEASTPLTVQTKPTTNTKLIAIEKPDSVDPKMTEPKAITIPETEEMSTAKAITNAKSEFNEPKLNTPKPITDEKPRVAIKQDSIKIDNEVIKKATPSIPKKEEKPIIEYAITGKYDAAFQYHLPYSKNAVFTISQGYQGSISHQNKFALDFSMPSGTTIYLSREGVVLEVVENNTQGCGSQDCAKYDNYIIVQHPDGSFAKYAHIKNDGAIVAQGDVITMGQLIGYTGNTGWTATPTLHFEVFVQKEKERKTIKTNFLTGDGSDYGILAEQRRYKKEY